MNIKIWMRAVALLTVATFLTTGCMSLQNVPLSQGDQNVTRPAIKAGESVVVTKKDGAKQKFKVLKVEDDALVGHNVRINYTDMSALEVMRGDDAHGHKALIIGGVLLGVAAIAVATSGGGHGGSGY
jgi:uncharacterized protein YcfL